MEGWRRRAAQRGRRQRRNWLLIKSCRPKHWMISETKSATIWISVLDAYSHTTTCTAVGLIASIWFKERRIFLYLKNVIIISRCLSISVSLSSLSDSQTFFNDVPSYINTFFLVKYELTRAKHFSVEKKQKRALKRYAYSAAPSVCDLLNNNLVDEKHLNAISNV